MARGGALQFNPTITMCCENPAPSQVFLNAQPVRGCPVSQLCTQAIIEVADSPLKMTLGGLVLLIDSPDETGSGSVPATAPSHTRMGRPGYSPASSKLRSSLKFYVDTEETACQILTSVQRWSICPGPPIRTWTIHDFQPQWNRHWPHRSRGRELF